MDRAGGPIRTCSELMPNGSPTSWVDTASRVVVQVGFPTVVAGVLLWFLLTKFQDNMNSITTRMSSNTQAAAELVASEKAAFDEMRKQSGELTQQTAYMSQVARDVTDLLKLRQEELSTLKRIEEGGRK